MVEEKVHENSRDFGIADPEYIIHELHINVRVWNLVHLERPLKLRSGDRTYSIRPTCDAEIFDISPANEARFQFS